MTVRVRSLPVEEWPEADRRAWQEACRPGERLVRGGRAARLKKVSRDDLQRRYGNLLDFCERMGCLDLTAPAAAYVRADIISPFIDELKARVSSVTLSQTICKIRRFAELIAPQADLEWLREITRDLDMAKVPRPKHHKIVDPRLIVEAGLSRMRQTEKLARAGDRIAAARFRDGLMIVLLAYCPIRLKNFASLSLNRQIRDIGGEWWIVLPASETKTGRADERPVPARLTPCIETWMELRDVLMTTESDRFWIGRYGKPMTYLAVEGAIARATLATPGRAIYPHRFRDSAVLLVASEAGDEMGIASATLQHADPRTTEKHYNKGAMVTAAQAYEQLLESFVKHQVEDRDELNM